MDDSDTDGSCWDAYDWRRLIADIEDVDETSDEDCEEALALIESAPSTPIPGSAWLGDGGGI